LSDVDPDLCLGLPPALSSEIEAHVVRFERYSKLPLELRIKKEKLDKMTQNDPKKL
jgi:hypothetical protein